MTNEVCQVDPEQEHPEDDPEKKKVPEDPVVEHPEQELEVERFDGDPEKERADDPKDCQHPGSRSLRYPATEAVRRQAAGSEKHFCHAKWPDLL